MTADNKSGPGWKKSLLLAAAAVLMTAGCSLGPSSMLHPRKHHPEKIPQEVVEMSEKVADTQRFYHRNLEKKQEKMAEIEPVLPQYDPLQDQKVSFSMVDENLQNVLYALSQAVGVSFILDPEISNEQRTLTLHFENTSAATVLKEILAAYDLFYNVQGDIIRISPYKEKIFKLGFMDSRLESKFDVGGDVLGASEETISQGLAGSFKIRGEGVTQKSPYKVLEAMIKPLLSEQGKYSINQISGTLYVKDRPRVIRSVARMVNHLKKMMGRQILIEARIIEVLLSDKYKYGIDWELLRNLDDAATELTRASWGVGNGLILNGTSGEFSLTATIDALRTFGDARVVSNPTIRCKHGQPALISVGTSITYKKSVETTRTTTGSTQDVSTDVEVSTLFDGLILGVVPFIDSGGRITLLINPIKSDVDRNSLEETEISEGMSISLPEVDIKEISSTIALRDGDVVILGGLIDRRKIRDDRGVPFLSAIPVLGYLFKREYERVESRELVLILSVKLV